MKSMTGALATYFATQQQIIKADLYTWTFADGTILRTTDADVALSFAGFTYASCAPICERTKVSIKIGVEVATMDVTVKPLPGDLIGGLTWQTATRLGYLDGATLLVETAYLSAWPTVVGKLHVFQGLASDIIPSRTQISITIKSTLELLVQPFPRNVYQSVCSHTVYDPGCALSKAAYTFTGTVGSSPAPTLTSFDTDHTQPIGYFEQGVVTFTSGANIGLKRTVKSYSPFGFTIALPLPFVPAPGDTVSAFAGCDKTKATCGSKFSNLGKFRGFPYIPNPETAAPAVTGSTTKSGK